MEHVQAPRKRSLVTKPILDLQTWHTNAFLLELNTSKTKSDQKREYCHCNTESDKQWSTEGDIPVDKETPVITLSICQF